MATVFPVCALAALSPKMEQLRVALQTELDELSTGHPEWALQLGWASDDGNFGIASGVVDDGKTKRAPTAFDKFLFGSGTKPVTSVAVLRLVEAGAVSLADTVAQHVDQVLWTQNGTNLTSLFGAQAAHVTVENLLRMQSGLADFDTPSLDDAILRHGDELWPPYAILRAAASAKPPMHFAPGTHT